VSFCRRSPPARGITSRIPPSLGGAICGVALIMNDPHAEYRPNVRAPVTTLLWLASLGIVF
ncbi:MAG: hypothetical protein O2973_03705, partial [Gemmatimonadetes bacterium]|nr:hypothetical protein [Gemmatimonadota bacterium]